MVRPSGTVTLLFSDVESSTRLWEQAPVEMATAVERHDAIVRGAVEHEGGYVFKTVGDEFCVAFATVQSALAAALAAQCALSAEPWPEATTLRARMALHTGACQERDDDYFGPTVNRAARLMAVGHGGQVLVSGASAELLGDRPADRTSLRDLGLHRLRDLGRPEHVFQLVAEGLRGEFPPLRSLDNPDLPNNLPALLSAFVGRERELGDVRALVRDARLVTFTGAGGAGKTRLAVQAAAELLDGSGDGVWLVELAPVTDEAQVPLAVAAAIGLKDGMDVDPQGALLAALAPQTSLFVLDNCEHLVDRVAKLVDAILRSCPGVHVLATSREPLGVDGERVYRVPSMSTPPEDIESLDEAEGFDAVTLFVSRATDAGVAVSDRDAALVTSVCRRLDGIPLALELAAARLSSMSLVQLSDRLDQRFRLLTGGSRSAMARQQTLQALVDWSYGLLNPVEQSVLRRLSVFVGGFELDAAESVCAGEDVDEFDVLNLLHSLVEKSLVVADQDAGSVRYRLLETIRQYGAAELLRVGGDEAVLEARDRHAKYCLELAGRASGELEGAEQGAWLARLDLEADNLRAAMAHLASTPGRARDTLAMVTDLERFFKTRGAVEVIPRVTEALDELGAVAEELVVRALISKSIFVGWLLGASDVAAVQRASSTIERAHAMAIELGLPRLQARAAGVHAMFCQYHRDLEGAAANLDEAFTLADTLDDDRLRVELLVFALNHRVMATRGTTTEQRVEMIDRLRRLSESLGDVGGIGNAVSQAAALAADEGRMEDAKRLYAELFSRTEALGNRENYFPQLNNLTLCDLELGLYEEAEVGLRLAIRQYRRLGLRHPVGDLIFAGACIATHHGDDVKGARLHAAADEFRREAYETGLLYATESELAMQAASVQHALGALGQERFDREQAIGRHLSANEALELALGRQL